ncbi:MAG: DUF3849 domain-containing protein [Oscillospiraceae bacterium]|nr:DUF3849 domain-containing protein [Oscillospiraceae bacterium]
MERDFPYLYYGSYGDAKQYGEEKKYDASFRENVVCSRAIEQAVRDCSDERGGLSEGCARQVLEQYGFKRVNFVLANSLQEMGYPYLISDETRAWGQGFYVPADGRNRYFTVDTAADLLDKFIGQVKACYQALGLFGQEHCVDSQDQQDYTGKVLILSPFSMEESCWDTHSQVWLAEGGFGCYPGTYGWALYATCLGSGEQARWDRSNFIGIMKEEYLPDWAREKLEEIQAPKQSGPTMNM